VLGLIVIFAVVLFALAILLWAGTLGLQGLIYSEPATQLFWRAPAAGAVLTGLVGLWCLLSYRMYSEDLKTNPAQTELPLDTIFRFQPTQTTQVDKFWSLVGEQEILFRKFETGQATIGKMKTGDARAPEYKDEQGKPWSRSSTEGIVKAILVEEGGQKLRFEPRLARDGTFPPKAPPFPGYYQVGGRRYMDTLGRVSQFQWGRWFLNMTFNLLHFGAWFVCLWLLLQYQWPHALGLAAALWAAMTLLALPLLFDHMRDVALERAAPSAPAAMQAPFSPAWSNRGESLAEPAA
jgi:hypothetical protein